MYVNRNQIGAVVGVQPFGGEGLSGTGPKTGGPTYLEAFAVERVRDHRPHRFRRQRDAARRRERRGMILALRPLYASVWRVHLSLDDVTIRSAC